MDSDSTIPINNAGKTGASSEQSASSAYEAGDILLDRYKVIRLLGIGGMGSVYEVEHMVLNGHYAMKLLNKNQTNDVTWRRFEIEARATSKLEHPNLIKVHDFGLLSNGQPYLIMDLIKGETLAELLKRQGRLSVDQTIKLFIQVGFALSYAHSNGIVHRDIKPSNIILSATDSEKTEDSLVKLVDFGIAKLTGQDGFNQQTLTKTGEIFGSPLYMSPEQCLGSGVDQRSDLYSLGCVMFEALTGAPPLVGDSALSTMMKHQSENPLSLKEASLGVEFPKGIEQVVSRLLAKDVKVRYQSAQLFTADLVGLETGQNFAVSPPQELEQAAQPKEILVRNSALAVGAAVLFLIGMLIGYRNPVRESRFPVVAGSKERHSLPPENVNNYNSDEVAKSEAADRVDKSFSLESRKTKPFSTLLPNRTRTFNFPDFKIGAYSAPGSPPTMPPWTVHNFTGISFRPNLDFRNHPQMFLRFRPDDIYSLDLSNERTFLGFVTDKLSDADEILPFVTHLKSIIYLGVTDSELTAKGIRCIGQLPNLKRLYLDRSSVNGEEIAKLPNLMRLEKLSLHSVKDTEPLIQALSRSKELRSLWLVNCNINTQKLMKLAKLPMLQELELSKNPQITDKDLKYLPANLTRLGVIGCPVTPNSIKELARLKKLRLLFLDESLWKGEDLIAIHSLLPQTVIQIAKDKPTANSLRNQEDVKEEANF